MTPNSINKLIASNLKRLRKNRSLTQKQLAKILNIRKDTISEFETCRVAIGKKLISRFCHVLKAKPWEFYVDSKTPIAIDLKEKEFLLLFKKASRLGIVARIEQFAKFRIEEAEQKTKFILHK